MPPACAGTEIPDNTCASLRRLGSVLGRREQITGEPALELVVGFAAFLTRVAWGKDSLQPELPMVISTVTHVAVGALLLATTVVLAIQIWRHVPVTFAERVPGAERTPQTA